MVVSKKKAPKTEAGLRISAKNLGAFALPGSCRRCLWLNLKVGHKLPYQIFPGIFSSIDSYNKKLVHSYHDKFGRMPGWLLQQLPDVVGYIDPPHYSKFTIFDAETQITLRGTPDGIFICKDGSRLIIDNKTARYSKGADHLLPMYEVQLNAYARIANETGYGPVSGLVLLYMEPVTDEGAIQDVDNHTAAGFRMHFAATAHEVALRPEILKPLLQEVRALTELECAPPAAVGCENCAQLTTLSELAQRKAVL